MSAPARLEQLRIAGWAHTRFGRSEESLDQLISRVGAEAIAEAGLAPEDIDEVVLGHFNSGMHPLTTTAPLALLDGVVPVGTPSVRVENACASGSAAVHTGMRSILAGTARTVLVIGAEKMSAVPADVVDAGLLGADADAAGTGRPGGFAGLFATVADAYAEAHGSPDEAMALIAAKNHRHGVRNPFAQFQRDLGEDFCATVSDRNPLVVGRLRRTDCSPVSDGAAALVLAADEVSADAARTPGVRVLGFGQATDHPHAAHRDPLAFRGAEVAWNRALGMAGVSLADLSMIEVHDCFTIAELLLYEAFGLAPRGRGAELLAEGTVHRDGALPVNVSGGLKSKGHPVGATGVSQHVMAAMQLTGTAGELQLPGAHTVAVHNMGGMGIANYVGVLRAA